MSQMNLQNITGWSALIQATAEVTSFITLILFFMKGGLWGPVNDTLSVIWALLLIPIAGWFFLSNRQISLPLSAAVALVGVGAMITFAALQFVQVIGLVHYEQAASAILSLTGVLGLWLVVNGLMVRSSGILPRGLILMLLVAGAGLLLCAVGYFLGGEQYPLTAAGYGIGFIGGFVWPIWLARVLFAGARAIFK